VKASSSSSLSSQRFLGRRSEDQLQEVAEDADLFFQHLLAEQIPSVQELVEGCDREVAHDDVVPGEGQQRLLVGIPSGSPRADFHEFVPASEERQQPVAERAGEVLASVQRFVLDQAGNSGMRRHHAHHRFDELFRGLSSVSSRNRVIR
jgi:hypothetical protein